MSDNICQNVNSDGLTSTSGSLEFLILNEVMKNIRIGIKQAQIALSDENRLVAFCFAIKDRKSVV